MAVAPMYERPVLPFDGWNAQCEPLPYRPEVVEGIELHGWSYVRPFARLPGVNGRSPFWSTVDNRLVLAQLAAFRGPWDVILDGELLPRTKTGLHSLREAAEYGVRYMLDKDATPGKFDDLPTEDEA